MPKGIIRFLIHTLNQDMSRGGGNPEHVNTPSLICFVATVLVPSRLRCPDPAVSTTAEVSGGWHQGGPQLGQDMMGMKKVVVVVWGGRWSG